MHVKLIILIITSLAIETMILFDFNIKSDISNWTVVNDGVMGGLSAGNFSLNENGNGVYKGTVSLENNGGFSSLRYRFPIKKVDGFTKAILKLKGDGKNYQFRLRSNAYERHSYIATFQTTGDWQLIEITLAEMYPAFRGNKLNIPNYPIENLEEIAFLIGNKKEESFLLEIDSIILK